MTKNKFPTLHGKLITNRRLKRSDVDDIFEAGNHPQVAKYLPFHEYPYTMEQANTTVRRAHKTFRDGSGLFFGIEENSSEKIVGTCDLFNISGKDNHAEIGYWLGYKYWRKGYTYESVMLTLDYAFNQLQLHRVYATMSALNTGSKKLLTKASFTHEATWRECTWQDNQYVDALGFGILKDEYLKG